VSAKLQTFGTPFRSDQIGLSELRRNDAAQLGDLPSTAMALSIDAEGTRKSPENGWLRIKKIALATANEPKASATSWLEDADLAEAAQAARAELEAETEASHWSK
jgi:hypothetical protein